MNEIPYCPVVRPSLEEFNDFNSFVEKLDRTYKDEWGMVKVCSMIYYPSSREVSFILIE